MHISSLFHGLLVSAVTLPLSRAAFAGTLEQCPVGPKWLQVWKNPGNVLEPFGWVGVPGINQSYGVITTETTAGRAVFDTSIDVECQCFDTGFCKFMTYCTTCGLVPVGLDIAAFWKYDPLQTEVNPGWIFYNFQGPPPTQGLPEGDDAHVFWFTTDDQGFVHPVTANMNSSSDPTNQYNATYDSTGDQLIFKPEIAFTYPYYALKWVDFPY